MVLWYLAATLPTGRAQVISEFLAASRGGADSLKDAEGDPSDWIEVLNDTPAVVQLGGWYLTDDPGNLIKWQIPVTALQSNARRIFFASGKDGVIAGAQGDEAHTNFRLDAGGEFLALVQPDGVTIASQFAPAFPPQVADISYGIGTSEGSNIVTGAEVRYHVPTAEPAENWRLMNFDDSAWPTARTPIGFGYPEIPAGPNGEIGLGIMRGMNASVFLRLPFDITDPAGVRSLTLRMIFEDGFAAYLNGTLVAEANTPSPLLFSSSATDTLELAPDDPFTNFNLEFAGVLEEGDNVLAIQGLNNSVNSSDFMLIPELDVQFDPSSPQLINGYFPEPTPGAPNGPAVPSLVHDTRFSVDRGFYDSPFEVAITSEPPGALIRYTLDGTRPTETHGSVYTAPISIDRSTVLRAAAFLPGVPATNVDTQSYIFLEDVVSQPANPRGWPGTWNSVSADYEVDPDVTRDPRYRNTFLDDLRAVPTLSLVMDQDDLLSPERGIYVNGAEHSPHGRGPGWERDVSLEYFDAHAPGEEFQVDAGIRLHGGISRNAEYKKHTLRIYFREQYGAAALEFPLFGDTGIRRFDQLVLRANVSDGWIQGPTGFASHSTYTRDPFGRETMREMGHDQPLDAFVHLYINGLYWGMYNIVERPNAGFAAEHFGGEKDNWDALKHINSNKAEAISGTRNEWDRMMALARGNLNDLRQYRRLEDMVDLTQFADYLITNMTIGNWDWPQNNWYAARRREPPGRFLFFMWDAETTLEVGAGMATDVNYNKTNPSDGDTPGGLFQRLRGSAEFRLLMGDRIHRHYFNGGALTSERNIDRMREVASWIGRAMVGESARWGDYQTDLGNRSPPLTYDDTWLPNLRQLYSQYLPAREGIVLNQFRQAGLYPNLAAPSFNRHGGIVPDGFALIMTGPGRIYYTLDGSDPRSRGGAVAAGARLVSEFGLEAVQILDSGAPARAFVPVDGSLGSSWTDPLFDDAGWLAGTTGIGFEAPGENFAQLLGLDVEGTMYTNNATMYVRLPFDLEDPGLVQSLTLKMKYDDGFFAFLNGTEVASANAPAAVEWNSRATATQIDAAAVVFEDFDFSAHPSLLRVGTNVLAIQGLNRRAEGSDVLILPELHGEVLVAGDSDLILHNSVVVMARSLQGSTWSALNEATFQVGAVAANDSNLTISKVHYRPSSPSAAENAAGFTSRKDFEYVELFNRGAWPITLAGLRFTGAFHFTFPDGPLSDLPPGARMLVVNNRAAFEFRNGVDPGRHIAGEFSDGNLSNDGEEIVLLDANEAVVLRLTYNDAGAWPDSPDGDGPALVLISPEDGPAFNDPGNWRPSLEAEGSPGRDDRLTLADWLQQNGLGDPDDDPAGIGISNLLAFAVGADLVSPPHAAMPPAPTIEAFDVGGVIDDYPVFRYRRRIGADHLVFRPEATHHPGRDPWNPDGFVLLSATDNGDGTMTVAVRAPNPVSALDGHGFLRLRMSVE